MFALPTGTQIWIAAGVTDLRRGFTGLSAAVQTVLEQKPFSGLKRPAEPTKYLHGLGKNDCKKARP